MSDHFIWVLLQKTHLTVLSATVEVFSVACAFLLEVVSPAIFALVTRRASGVCGDESILVVGQAQDCNRVSTDMTCV